MINSGIKNDPHISRHVYIDNPYDAPQLFSCMEINYNIRTEGTCRSNWKVFESEQLI